MTGSERTTALVVLGAAVWAEEKPSPSLKRRAAHAAMLYQQNAAQFIVASGGLGLHPPSEAEAIKRLLLSDGVPADAILLEEESHSTLENVLYSARILQARSISEVIVVSDKYHLMRSTMCFRALGFATTGSGPDRAASGIPLRKWVFHYLRELIALPWYAVRLKRLRTMFRTPASE